MVGVRTRSPLATVALLVLLALLGAAPTAGTARAQDPVELLVWDQFTGPNVTDVVDAIYESFTEQNPNITIRREAVSSDQLRQTLRTSLGSGTGPDIVFYDAGPGYAGVLAEAGLLLPLDDLATQYGWRDRIAEAALAGASIGDQLYGLPLQVDLIGMYVNQTLMEEEGFQIPETTEQMAELCRQAREKGYDSPLAFSNNPGWQAYHPFAMTANAMVGPEAVRALLFESQGSWNTPEMVTAIRSFFVDLRDAGCYSEEANALQYADGNDLFFTGQSLIHPTGSWLVTDIETNMPDAEVEFVPFPAPPGATAGRLWSSGVGSAYFASANSEHQEEVGRFLDYLFSPETARRWIEEAQFVVPVDVDTSDIEAGPLFRTILDQIAAASRGEIQLGYNVDVLAPQEFNDAMQNGFQAMVAGDKSAEQQAADLQAAWEASAGQ